MENRLEDTAGKPQPVKQFLRFAAALLFLFDGDKESVRRFEQHRRARNALSRADLENAPRARTAHGIQKILKRILFRGRIAPLRHAFAERGKPFVDAKADERTGVLHTQTRRMIAVMTGFCFVFL